MGRAKRDSTAIRRKSQPSPASCSSGESTLSNSICCIKATSRIRQPRRPESSGAQRPPRGGLHVRLQPALLAQRATQIIQLVRALRRETPELTLSLVGRKGLSLRWLPLARRISRRRLNELAVELAEFRWESLREFEHPDFLPGIVKYGGLAGCLAAEPQRRVLVLQRPNAVDLSAAAKAASLAGHADRLNCTALSADELIEERIADWIGKEP